MSTKPSASADRVITTNRRARHNYEILAEVECGIMLQGSEVKSLRNNKVTLDDGYARFEGGEVWLLNCDIAEYPQATYLNHERKRPRKLLLKKKEIRKYAESANLRGVTLIPLSMQFRRGNVKVTIALAKGRREYDKRQELKKVDAEKEIRNRLRHARN